MQLLDAPTRLAELRGPKILVTGPTAIGKTSLLKTSRRTGSGLDLFRVVKKRRL